VLINTIGVCTTELLDDGIQARFGGVGPPTTIKDANEIITHLSDLVTMQVHSRETIVISAHASVSVSPVLACLDSGVHELLDLTHDVVSEVCLMDWCWCCSGSEASSTGSALKFAAQLVEHQISAGVIVEHGAVNSAIKCLGEDGELLGGESDGDHRGCVNCRHYRHRVRRFGCRLGPLRHLAHGRRCNDGSAQRMDAMHQRSHSRCGCADDPYP